MTLRFPIPALIGLFGLVLVCLPLKAADEPTVLVLGDSLVAGYNLAPEMGFPEQLDRALDAADHPVTMINAGVSGDTTAGGLARLGWVLTDRIDVMIVTLGGNDALRGLPPEAAEKNLAEIIEAAQAKGATVLLTGMLAPRNLGADYAAEFDAIFPRLAERYGTVFYPFFLDGVAATPTLNQSDGIHPTEEGVALIVEKILPTVLQALGQ